jgi:Flp pilus assembly pilin Flp
MLTSTYNNAIWLRNRTIETVRRRAAEDRGAALVEYGLLLALIVIVCIGAVSYFGSSSSGSATDSANKISAAN